MQEKFPERYGRDVKRFSIENEIETCFIFYFLPLSVFSAFEEKFLQVLGINGIIIAWKTRRIFDTAYRTNGRKFRIESSIKTPFIFLRDEKKVSLKYLHERRKICGANYAV